MMNWLRSFIGATSTAGKRAIFETCSAQRATATKGMRGKVVTVTQSSEQPCSSSWGVAVYKYPMPREAATMTRNLEISLTRRLLSLPLPIAQRSGEVRYPLFRRASLGRARMPLRGHLSDASLYEELSNPATNP